MSVHYLYSVFYGVSQKRQESYGLKSATSGLCSSRRTSSCHAHIWVLCPIQPRVWFTNSDFCKWPRATEWSNDAVRFRPAVLILTMCSMKMLRIGYCNCSRHFLYVLLTSILTYVMTSHRSETFLLNYFLLSCLTEKVKHSLTFRRTCDQCVCLLVDWLSGETEFHLCLLCSMANLLGIGISRHCPTVLHTT